MIKYNVVAIRDGEIIGVCEYDPANDGKRDERVQAAINKIAAEIGIQAPKLELRSRGVEVDGIEWGKMHGDLQPGMVEIGFGKWGFNNETP